MIEAGSLHDILTKIVQDMLPEGASVSEIDPEDDLAKVGLTSLNMVNLMLTLEAKMDVTLPPSVINPQNFRSISSIATMLETLPVS
jgi:acyl carrier protein